MNNIYFTGIAAHPFWRSLFDAGSIAVIGANNTIGSWGFDAMRAALGSLKTDPQRQVYAVNPNVQEVMGRPSYKSILDIPHPVELAVVVVRAELVPSIFRQCAEKKVKAAVVISAGFAEVDAAGARLQSEMVETARQAGMHFVGPNCVGHADAHSLVASAAVVNRIGPGPLSLITQSGTLGATIIQNAADHGIGLNKFISTGNEADLHFEDYLEYLAQDEDTRIIAGYIEGLREGRRFYELARETTLHKPIVVIKTGTTEGSSRAAKSHTGALAGSDAIYSAAFKQAGVIRVEDEEELCDLAVALLNQPLPKGDGIGVLTMGGGFGVITAEACEKEGLRMADLEPGTLEKMNRILPPRWSHANPVDLVGIKTMGDNSTVPTLLRLMMEDNNIDILVSLLPPVMVPPEIGGSANPEQIKLMQAQYEKHMDFLHQMVRQYEKPLILLQMFKLPKPAGFAPATRLERIPEYFNPRRAARVLRHLVWYGRYLEQHRG